MIKTIPVNKVRRFEVEDHSRRGYRAYALEGKNMEVLSKVLYYRFYMDNFYIGNVIFVKDRKHES